MCENRPKVILGLFGDASKEQSGQFIKLAHIRDLLSKNWDLMRPQIKAKCLFAIAYDYLVIDLEEYTEILVDNALSVCPEYLESFVIEDMRQNEDFAHMILQLDLYFEGELGIMEIKEK